MRSVADLYALEADQLARLEGFARKSARALCDAIAASRSPRLDRFLHALGIPHSGRLEGFTRAEAKETVEELGARTASSVSGATDYLVVGDAPGAKLDAARERGVEVLDEADFARLVGSGQ